MLIKHLKNIAQELPSLAGTKGCSRRWLISQKDGAEHYAMKLFELEPGGVIPLHTHDDTEHEIFIVEGEGVLHDSQKETRVTQGDAIFVKSREQHSFKNISNKPLKFICVVSIL